MNNVRYRLNKEPPYPRWYTYRDPYIQNDLENLKNETAVYYERLKTLTQPILTSMLQRKITFSGTEPNAAGSKNSIIKQMQKIDLEFITTVFGKLNDESAFFVTKKISSFGTTITDADSEYLKIEDVSITNRTFKQFDIGKPFDEQLILGVLSLFRQRDDTIFNVTKMSNFAYWTVSISLPY